MFSTDSLGRQWVKTLSGLILLLWIAEGDIAVGYNRPQ